MRRNSIGIVGSPIVSTVSHTSPHGVAADCIRVSVAIVVVFMPGFPPFGQSQPIHDGTTATCYYRVRFGREVGDWCTRAFQPHDRHVIWGGVEKERM